MSADLIKRTSRAIAACKDDTPILKAVLLDCKAEIQRLESELQKAREYVHLTDYEITKAINYILVHEHFMKQLRALEQAIIARQNLIVVESKP